MLNHKVEIYIPRNDAKQEGVMADVFYKFCREFSGATVIPALGGRIDDKGSIVTDKIGIVFSYVAEVTPEIRKILKKIAVDVREALEEDAVTMMIDGAAEFY